MDAGLALTLSPTCLPLQGLKLDKLGDLNKPLNKHMEMRALRLLLGLALCALQASARAAQGLPATCRVPAEIQATAEVTHAHGCRPSPPRSPRTRRCSRAHLSLLWGQAGQSLQLLRRPQRPQQQREQGAQQHWRRTCGWRCSSGC